MFVSPELWKCLPHAEEYDVKMGIEVAAPWHFDHPWIMRHMEMMERTKTRHADSFPTWAFSPKRLPRVMKERALRNGATPAVLTTSVLAYEQGILSEYIIAEARNMGGNPVTSASLKRAGTMFGRSPSACSNSCRISSTFTPSSYDMVDDEHEYSIPYDKIVPVLIQGGFNGYLSSEYEGRLANPGCHEVDSLEQVSGVSTPCSGVCG